MNFNAISSYEQNIQTLSQVRESLPEEGGQEASAKAMNAAALGNTSAGQVVTGEIVKIQGDKVLISMSDSQTVTARLEADFSLSVGQSLAFEVKSNTGSLISLTPLFNNSAVNPAAIKALTEASVLVDENSLKMASAMMDEGMSIDKNSLQNMSRLMKLFPDANPADLVSMTKQSIPINETTISQFSAYSGNEHHILSIADDLADNINSVISELPLSDKNELISVFNGTVDEKVLSELANGLEKIEHNHETELLKMLNIEKNVEAASNETSSSLEKASLAEVVLENESGIKEIIPEDVRKELASNLKELGLSEESLAAIENGTISPNKALNYIQGCIDIVSKGALEELMLPEDKIEKMKHSLDEILKGDGFKSLLKESLLGDFSIKADGETDKQKVRELYERILRDVDKAEQILEKLGKGDSDAAKGLANIKENVDFLNTVNESMAFVQLPLKMAGENAHGDLYVYANKKKLSEKDGEITALLHLEMEHLGTMDIHVKMKDKEHINTNFVLEKEEMIDFIAENIHVLDERLRDRGYNMTSTVSSKPEEEVGKNQAIEEAFRKETGTVKNVTARYSFDVKA